MNLSPISQLGKPDPIVMTDKKKTHHYCTIHSSLRSVSKWAKKYLIIQKCKKLKIKVKLNSLIPINFCVKEATFSSLVSLVYSKLKIIILQIHSTS
jgi:hypothetical protein